MTLNDFFFLAKKYCGAVEYVRCIGTRLAAYGMESCLFAVDMNIENPELEKIHFKGHISGGLLGEIGIGVPDAYNKNCPLIAKIEFTDRSKTTITISSPSNFEAWIKKECPYYAFSKKPHGWWAGEYLGKQCTFFQGKQISNITLTRTLNEI